MQLGHDQEGRVTQSDMEAGFISDSIYKIVGAGEEIYERLVPLCHLLAEHK